MALILSKVAFKSAADKNLLPMGEPIIVAQVLETPSVVENADIIYTTATNELQINGTGFACAKVVSFYFDPPLYKEVGYEVVTKFPIRQNFIKLRLRHGYKWREEPGPLSIIGVDTGGGPVKLNGEVGVRVAIVQADLNNRGVKVETTADKQVIYHDQSEVLIKGEGFNLLGNTLFWANGLLGKGINYTTVETTESSIRLRLNSPGSHWRKNVESLPGFLTLLAVNAGEGFVAVGPTNAAKGRDVAMVFERPQVFSSNTELYRTHSIELHIKGGGFPKILAKPKLTFVPALVEDVDYKINVLDRSELEITLLDGKAWRADAGPLIVSSINTGAGEVVLPGDGVHVAEVIADLESDALLKPSQRPVVFLENPTPSPSLQRPVDLRVGSTPKPSSRPTGSPSLQISSNPQHDIVLTISSSTVDVFVAGAVFGAAFVLLALYLFQRFISPSGTHAYSPLRTSARDGVELAVLNNNDPTHSSQSSGVDM